MVDMIVIKNIDMIIETRAHVKPTVKEESSVKYPSGGSDPWLVFIRGSVKGPIPSSGR